MLQFLISMIFNKELRGKGYYARTLASILNKYDI